ncbi:YgjP-like metallopeptidase domain-containing protein [Ideonella sp.]|uniref:M48 metallopeptidase family protein n=1 Tax=Ideonella sp. TaxID=1929293 RepID=UPI003BB693F4
MSSESATALLQRFLAGYPPALLLQVQELLAAGRLGQVLAAKYPEAHTVRTDSALYDYTQAIKQRAMRQSGPLSMVVYDNKLRVLTQALGTHTTIARVQGGKLKAKREIRIAGLFRDAPEAFLRMIVVHELAHLKEREHDKAFYSLCQHMEPDYHQLEFDLRLYLLHQAQQRSGGAASERA